MKILESLIHLNLLQNFELAWLRELWALLHYLNPMYSELHGVLVTGKQPNINSYMA